MSPRSSAAHDILTEVAAIAALPGRLSARAEELLQPLHRLIRFDAARIALLDGERKRQPPAISHGYPDRTEQYLNGPEFMHDLELVGLLRNRAPMRLKDLPVAPMELRVWAEQLCPAGFREGVGAPLVTQDGRYLGLLSANTVSATPLSDSACSLLHTLAPIIAHAVDPMRTVSALAALVTDAIAGVALAHNGDARPVPGLAGHRLLAPGSPLLAEAAACYAEGDTRATFLTPAGQGSEPYGYLKAAMLACPDEPPHDLAAVVLLRPPGDLRHLSHREMVVLGMLVTGSTAPGIAARMGITTRAVRGALEHALLKLGAPSGDAAVMRAADHGLYIPPSLA